MLGNKLLNYMKCDLYHLFDDYMSTYGSGGSQFNQSVSETEMSPPSKTISTLKVRFKKHKMESRMGVSK